MANVEKRFICPVCNKSYFSRHGLYYHELTHNSNPSVRKPFSCQKCPQRFSTRQGMENHKVRHETELNLRRPFECPECGNRYTQNGYLGIHMRTKHKLRRRGVKEPTIIHPPNPHACRSHNPTRQSEDCPAIVQSSNHKSIFVPISTCSECGLEFLQPIELDLHFLLVHSSSREGLNRPTIMHPSYQESRLFATCPMCSWQFLLPNDLYQHMLFCHNLTHDN